MKKKSIILISLSVFIPFIILVIFCWSRQIGIFGNNTLLVSDYKSQYISLLKWLRELGDGNLFYSMSNGLGGGMIGTIAYYLASPLNLLIFLFPKENILDASIFLITLKISLCGLTMFIYLKNKLKKENYFLLIFSSSYALISYVVNYNFHLMWLDGVMILPIVLLGIDRLFKGKSGLYIFSLFYAIISNYYIGYMICIMSVLYFIRQLFLQYSFKNNKKEIYKVCRRFIITSLLAGLLTMFLLYPTWLELANSYKADEAIKLGGVNLSFFDLWSRTYINSHNYQNILAPNLINIYSGLIMLPLVYFFFVNKKIKKKEKYVYGILLLVLLSGFFINLVNIIWHAFRSTNCFNYRYSFIISFIIILLSAKSFYKLSGVNKKHYLIFLIGYLILSLIILLRGYNYINYISIYVSSICIILYLCLLYFSSKNNKNRDLKVLLLIIPLAELFFNLFFSLEKFEYAPKNEYYRYTDEIVENINDLNLIEDEYRIEKNAMYSYNDGLLMNYHGISNFLSTTNISSFSFLEKVGYYNTGVSTIDYGYNTAVIRSILGVKYEINKLPKTEYKQIGSIELPSLEGILYHENFNVSSNVYENTNVLKLGYMIATNQTKLTEENLNPFEYQNYLLNDMLGNDTIYFHPYKKEKLSEGAYEFYIDNNKLVYLYYPYTETNERDTYVMVNKEKYHSVSEVFNYLANLDGETIRVSLEGSVSAYGEPVAYFFDQEAFSRDIEKLRENEIDFEVIKNGYIKGKINVESNYKRLFLSVLYEDGWKLYVDGKEMPIEVMYDTFIGATLKEGMHEFELVYKTPGLNLGIIISSVSGIFIGIYLLYEKQKINFLRNYY